MFQNLKVDIIYYDTPTDFELEFNLCGCCRMRLLTDKTDDQKLFLHMLARAVSRSRVVLLSGKLFGDDGIVDLTAKAIGKNTCIADNKLYGILSEDKIKIIKGAVPLVTPEGYFGGCIIESGPQAMILLSENKNIRKSIMQTLIHPYIEEISAIALKEKAQETRSSVNSEDTPSAEEVQAEETTENQMTDPVTEANEIKISFDEDTTEDADENPTFKEDEELFDQLFIEPSKEKLTKSGYYEEAYVPSSTENFVFDEELEFSPINTPKAFNLGKLILILTIVLLSLTAVVCFCLFYIPLSTGVTPIEFIEQIYKTLFGIL